MAKHKEYRSRALVLLKEDQITTNDTILTEYLHDKEKIFICKRISPLGNTWFNGTSYVDLMNPNAVKAFLESTHEKYKKSCDNYFGKEIPGIFTDKKSSFNSCFLSLISYFYYINVTSIAPFTLQASAQIPH